MKLIMLLLTLIISSCGIKSKSPIYGKSTVSDLVSLKGEPLERSVIPVHEGQVFTYDDNEKYQIKGDLVTHGFKEPKSNERNLLYWKHKFKDCDTKTIKISQAQDHEVAQYELVCSSLGLTVIYAEDSGYISRIIEHEKK